MGIVIDASAVAIAKPAQQLVPGGASTVASIAMLIAATTVQYAPSSHEYTRSSNTGALGLSMTWQHHGTVDERFW
jgi:hypothetical protein